jgi:hypothetical protein
MMLGMSLETFTLVHVAISLVGLAAGFVVVGGLLGDRRLDGSTAVFLAATVVTSVTGFGFPFERLLPSHVTGVLSLLVLVPCLLARYRFRLAGGWRRVYVITAVVALYFNTFVAVVQSFLKFPALRALAPTQSEAPFALAQGATLVAFVVLGVQSVRRFRS